MIDARSAIGTHDVLWVTLDTLRYDAAARALSRGLTPRLAELAGARGWERRHSPGSFTYSAHHAFFAGFLPTPPTPGPHPRLFAARFPGSETITERTFVFDAPDLPTGLAEAGYHTLCIGGVGFFNLQSRLATALPGLFSERHWRQSMGVASPTSTEEQVDRALASIDALPVRRRAFVFLNVSAIHEPNRIFLGPGATDGIEGQIAALAYADAHLGRLIDRLRERAPLLAMVCSDHGTAYGEDGQRGHRVAHPVVWEVPYLQAQLARVGESG